MGNDRYDVIVVGAGPAGSVAAIKLAQNDLLVALIERGKKPGSKNMFGGTLYRKPTAKIIPGFWEQDEVPLERIIVNEELWFMDKTSIVKTGFTGLKFGKPPYNKFSIIRSKFDPWFARQAVKEGAHLITETLVTDLVYEKNGLLSKKVSGVKLETGDIIYCSAVILAEGANAILTKKAGLRGNIESSHLKLYVKEELELPAKKIESRFNLEPDEGANFGMIGYPTSGVIGKAGIWTNKESISLIIGGYLNQIVNKGINPYQMLEHVKSHPLVKRLLEGAKTIAYKSHIIPKGGYEEIPKLYDDGILVAGDAAIMVSGRRGTDLAMLSGNYAAEIITQAKAAQDFSSNILKGYDKKIKESFFMEDVKDNQTTSYFEKHQDPDLLLSKATNEAAYSFLEVGMKSKKQKIKEIKDEIKNMQPLPKTASDLYHGLKDWRVL